MKIRLNGGEKADSNQAQELLTVIAWYFPQSWGKSFSFCPAVPLNDLLAFVTDPQWTRWNSKCQGISSSRDHTGFLKRCRISTDFRRRRDPLLIWTAPHTPLSRGSRTQSVKVCVGVSVCSCGWMMISAVLLSNQQLLIHLTEQINKAGHSWGACVCVCLESVSPWPEAAVIH